MPLQVWVGAIQVGCFAALIGLGYQLILRTARIFMFPLGAIASGGALLTSYLAVRNDWPFALAALVGVLVGAAVAIVADIAVLRPIQERAAAGDELVVVVGTIGTLFAIQQLDGTLFGRQSQRVPSFVEGSAFRFGGASISPQWVLTVVATLLIFVCGASMMKRAKFGRYMRAVGANPLAARLMGVPERRLRAVAFGLGGAVAVIAGLFLGTRSGVRFDSGFEWAMLGFIASIIGGSASVYGPLVGGLLVALIQAFASFKLGPAWLDYTTLALALVFFSVRPEGLFASKGRV